MKTLLLLFLLPCVALAGDVVFERIGFQTPSGIVYLDKDGKVSWGKVTPPVDYRQWLDDVVLEKATVPEADYNLNHAVRDYNMIVQRMVDQGQPDGKTDENAQKLWKALKTMFPKVFK